MTIDYLIIGQGISGTWLSYYLQKANKSFLVIDNNRANAPSRLTAGIINPVTGRRHVEVWLADIIIPFARKSYVAMGDELGITAISQNDIIDFFPSPQMRLSFQQRVEAGSSYAVLSSEENRFRDHFNYEFGYGEIRPVCTAHVETILPAWRQQLQSNNQLLEEEFDSNLLETSAKNIRYKDINAQKIIFCDGTNSLSNPWFKNLPFAPNKGEALTVEIPGLPAGQIYKKGMSLVPLASTGLWWIGSSYQWDFEDLAPTTEFYEKTESLLKQWLKIPFQITGHLAGERPATLERRPFVGMHPRQPSIGILNGMGTKGCSLAPYFARQLLHHLLYNKAFTPEADVSRFAKILQRS